MRAVLILWSKGYNRLNNNYPKIKVHNKSEWWLQLNLNTKNNILKPKIENRRENKQLIIQKSHNLIYDLKDN